MVEIINKKKTTLAAINAIEYPQKHRPYLGMSIMGHDCERYLWYTFRWCYTEILPYRKIRLFGIGHREESSIIDTLDTVGIAVYNQQEGMEAVHGHVKGHIDGKCIGVIEAPKTEHLA